MKAQPTPLPVSMCLAHGRDPCLLTEQVNVGDFKFLKTDGSQVWGCGRGNETGEQAGPRYGGHQISGKSLVLVLSVRGRLTNFPS